MEKGIGGKTLAELDGNMTMLEFIQWGQYYELPAKLRTLPVVRLMAFLKE